MIGAPNSRADPWAQSPLLRARDDPPPNRSNATRESCPARWICRPIEAARARCTRGFPRLLDRGQGRISGALHLFPRCRREPTAAWSRQFRFRAMRPSPQLTEIIRLVAGLPFDVAAETRLLVRVDRFTGEQRVEGSAQILAGHRNSIARPALMELASLKKSLLAIEQKKIRRARSAIRLGNFLGFVVKIRKLISGGFGLDRHLVWTVGRVVRRVVRVNADQCDAPRQVIGCQLNQPLAKVLHIRAVIAHENDDKARRSVEIRQANYFAGSIGKLKVRRRRSEREH